MFLFLSKTKVKLIERTSLERKELAPGGEDEKQKSPTELRQRLFHHNPHEMQQQSEALRCESKGNTAFRPQPVCLSDCSLTLLHQEQMVVSKCLFNNTYIKTGHWANVLEGDYGSPALPLSISASW